MSAYKIGYWTGVILMTSSAAGALALVAYLAGLSLGAWSW